VTKVSGDIYRAQRAYFERAYETGEHGWPTEGVSPMVARFLRTFRGRGRCVLDIGCGEGRHTRAFAGAGALVVGVDLEPKALARAREAVERGSGRGPGFVHADAFALPFAPPRSMSSLTTAVCTMFGVATRSGISNKSCRS